MTDTSRLKGPIPQTNKRDVNEALGEEEESYTTATDFLREKERIRRERERETESFLVPIVSFL